MRRYTITIGDKVFEVDILAVGQNQARVQVGGRTLEVTFHSQAGAPASDRPLPAAPGPPPAPPRVTPAPPRPAPAPAPPEKPSPAPGLGTVNAPMPGVILEVLVGVGDRVAVGDTVVKLEAMKMENDIRVTVSGVVSEVRVNKGASVAVGETLVVVAKG